MFLLQEKAFVQAWEAIMPEYRIYQLDHKGHSSSEPRFVTCKDDSEAEMESRKVLNSHALEIWCGKRKVATIKPDWISTVQDKQASASQP